jgi:predicted nuclease of predicted toxin-antitoxin system
LRDEFLVDMPLSPDLAEWLAAQGHDAVHAARLGLGQAPDIEIMNIARAAERVVVTADLDYPRLLAASGLRAPGLVLFRDGNWSDEDVIVRMAEALRALPESDFAHSIVVLERDRIRRRRLPLDR